MMNNSREEQTLEERWNYLKSCSINMIGTFAIRPNSDLPWTFYTIIQKIKEIEDKLAK